MTTVAVVAHADKTLGGGLGELREVLAREGFAHPEWYEVSKSKKAGRCARQAVESGADLVFVWGGDGTVQRCVDALAGTGVAIAILPAGTANLLATNLNIPKDLAGAVEVGLRGDRRPLDSGTVNGEHFAVMAGAGSDAVMIRDTDRRLKDRLGRAAYVWTEARNLQSSLAKSVVRVDGKRLFKGRVSCVLVGNVGRVIGGVTAFDGARPDDGRLEIGVVTARNTVQWARTLARVALGKAERSKYVHVASGKDFTVTFDRRFPYELDGSVRPAVRKLRIKVRPASITVCVPR
jgi:YegS/Rv2252/BmrU family lipid kinase